VTNGHKILAGYCERKRLLGGFAHRWKNNIDTNLREGGFMEVGWIYVSGPRLIATPYEKVNESSRSISTYFLSLFLLLPLGA
jgi:hypothetical protein